MTTPICVVRDGTLRGAVLRYLSATSDVSYTRTDHTLIVDTYLRVGTTLGIDWFMAVIQMCHETGGLSSWWSLRPRRNPAGLGVTGAQIPHQEPGPDRRTWQWDGQRNVWKQGLAFVTWDRHAIPAHLGRLLAYALYDDEVTEVQRTAITVATTLRPVPASIRGHIRTWEGLTGTWAIDPAYTTKLFTLAAKVEHL